MKKDLILMNLVTIQTSNWADLLAAVMVYKEILMHRNRTLIYGHPFLNKQVA